MGPAAVLGTDMHTTTTGGVLSETAALAKCPLPREEGRCGR